MQGSASGSAIVPAAQKPPTTDLAKHDNGKADKSIKGPPLLSRSHTVQVLVMLCLNSFLLLMCLYVLPAHLLWRRATKQHSLFTQGDQAQQEINKATVLSDIAFDAVVTATAESTSATRNILTAFRLLFSIPMSDTVAVSWILRSYRSTLAAVVLSQGWFVARYKGWWDEAEAMERGDRDEVLKRRRVGIGKQMEVSCMQDLTLDENSADTLHLPPLLIERHHDNVCSTLTHNRHILCPRPLWCAHSTVSLNVTKWALTNRPLTNYLYPQKTSRFAHPIVLPLRSHLLACFHPLGDG
jgi:hypothetical protein